VKPNNRGAREDKGIGTRSTGERDERGEEDERKERRVRDRREETGEKGQRRAARERIEIEGRRRGKNRGQGLQSTKDEG